MSPKPAAEVIRFPISLKIFGISIGMLILMMVVTVWTTINFHRVSKQLGLLSDYYIELDQKLANLRVDILREVLLIERVLHAKPQGATADGEARAQELIDEAGGCGDAAEDTVRRTLREAIADRTERRMMNLRVARLCTGAKLEQAATLIDQALALDQVRAVPEQVARFTRIKSELSNIAPAREKLHASFEKLLAELQSNDDRAMTAAQERIDEHRIDVSRRIRAVTRELQAGTRESADITEALETRTRLLSWGLTGVAAALGLLFTALITRNLVRPVRELLGLTKSIRSGDLDVSIQIRTGDEIGQLADSFNHMVGELKQKERITQIFGKYVDPRVVQGLLQGKTQFADGGERQTMSVFFSDIDGFTNVCEGLTPTAVVLLLNQYFSLMAEPIRAQQGIIDKYIGDAIMAFWGPPFCAAGEQATLACRAALDQRARMAALHTMLPEILGIRRNVPKITVRMGIATGDVTVGSIGSENARSYTVIGDTVNLASRLEGVNKLYGTQILLNEETRRLAGDAIEAREIDFLCVAGKTEPTRVYELIGLRGDIAPKTAELRQHYARGLDLYRSRKWDEARAAFAACLAIDPADGPSRLFVGRIGALEAKALPDQWDGVYALSEK